MLQGKKAYICSPLAAPNPEGVQHNMELAKYYLMQMKRLYHCRTFASHAHLPLMLDDRIPEERETAMQIGALMLDLCEVLIICGSCISEGMRREIQTAFEKGKDVYWYDSKMKPGELMKVDENVVIVFCTSFYTISNAGKGFEVDAEDFLSKPLLYKKVEHLLNKVYKKKLLCAEEKLFLKCQDGLITLQLSDIIYIQVRNKLLILHTNKGEIQSSQRMRELEERLSRKLFFRCHNSYIVNFDYVEGLKNDSVLVKDKNQQLKEIPVSKYKKEEFMKELAIYVGNR